MGLAGLHEALARAPRPTTRLALAPAERADIIIDFAGLSGRAFTLTNDAQVPFPSVRWAPQGTLIGSVRPGQNLFSFDPTTGPGYVLHCHILDHEDNEMMRPYAPVY